MEFIIALCVILTSFAPENAKADEHTTASATFMTTNVSKVFFDVFITFIPLKKYNSIRIH